MSYTVEFERNARKELLALPVAVRERIMEAVQRLAVDPFKPVNVKSLNGGVCRLRVGDYRVIFSVNTEVLIVLVPKSRSHGSSRNSRSCLLMSVAHELSGI